MGRMPFTTLWPGERRDRLRRQRPAQHQAASQAKVNALNKAGANVVMLDETGPAFGNNPHTPASWVILHACDIAKLCRFMSSMYHTFVDNQIDVQRRSSLLQSGRRVSCAPLEEGV